MNRFQQDGLTWQACVRLCWLVLAAVVLWAAMSPGATAQRGQRKQYRVGERVEVNLDHFGSDWQEAEVVEVRGRGTFVEVRLANGRTKIFTSDEVRPLKKKKTHPLIKHAPRTWTDTTGKYKVEASFVELAGKQVVLEKKGDGTRIKVPLQKLSTADQAEVAKLLAEASENPFEAVEDDSEDSSSPGSDLSPVSLLDAKRIVLAPAVRSRFQPEPLQTSQTALQGVAVALPPKADFFEKTTGIVAVAENSVAFVSRAITFGSNEGQGAIDIIDLQREKVSKTAVMPGPIVVADAIGGAKPRVLIYTISEEHGSDKPPQVLAIAELEGGKLNELTRWIPYAPDDFHDDDISFARFVDEQHAVTLNKAGTFVLWNVDEAKPVYYANIGRQLKPVTLNSRKYLVTEIEHSLSIIDVMEGKTVFSLPSLKVLSPSITLSPDGKQMAVTSGVNRFSIVDLTTGKLGESHQVSEHLNSIDWVTENQILLNGRYLYDLPRRFYLWEYQNPPSTLLRIAANTFLYTQGSTDHQGKGLFVATIPNGDALAKTASIDPSDLSVLDENDKVQLRINISLPGVSTSQVQRALTEMLAKHQVEVVPQSDLVLEAIAYRGQPKKWLFREFGSFRGGQEKTVTPNHYYLVLWDKENVVWRAAGYDDAHGFIRLNEGETLDSKLRAMTNPSADFFLHASIPKHLKWYASGAQTFGASKWGYGGLQQSEPTKLKPPDKSSAGNGPSQGNRQSPNRFRDQNITTRT